MIHKSHLKIPEMTFDKVEDFDMKWCEKMRKLVTQLTVVCTMNTLHLLITFNFLYFRVFLCMSIICNPLVTW